MPIIPTAGGPGISATHVELLGLIDGVFDGVSLWEHDPWRIVYANPGFWRLIGASAEESGLPARLVELVDRFRGQQGAAATVTTCLEIEGAGEPIEVRLCRVASGAQSFVGMIVHPHERHSSARRVSSDEARRDPLTGLPDREFLMQRLATLLTGERAADRQFAVVFLDLDNFKQVNDEFGHLIGDSVLREAARRIAGCLREGDHAVRYGGDEFVALVERVNSAEDVEPVIGRIHMALTTPIALATGEVTLSLSAGMALAPEAGGSAEELLAAADRAMYAAKRSAV